MADANLKFASPLRNKSLRNEDFMKQETKKEKKRKMPKEQRTPFKELSFSEKVSYIFGYYKYHMLAAVIIIVVIFSFINAYRRNNYNNVGTFAVVDGKITGYDSASDAITKGFTEYLGIDGKKDRVQFNYNYSLLEKPMDQEISVTINKIYILASTNSLDGYMANRDYIDFFSTDAEPFLMDLREILTPEELDKIGEKNIINYTKEDGTIIPIAVDLTDTKIRTQTDLSMESPCYGVVVTAPNKDNAVNFIKYAFEL